MDPISKLLTVEIFNLSDKRPMGIDDARILGDKDVGNWVIESLTQHYKDCKVSKELQKHFTEYKHD